MWTFAVLAAGQVIFPAKFLNLVSRQVVKWKSRDGSQMSHNGDI